MGTPRWVTQARELLADMETPVSAFLKLRNVGARFLLETVERGTTLGRYSLIGLHPLLELEFSRECTRVIVPDGKVFEASLPGNPCRVLQSFLKLLRPDKDPGPGDLLGGAVGYLSYEYIQFIERVPVKDDGRPGPPLARFMLPRSLVTFDHLRRKMSVRTMAPVKSGTDAPASADTVERFAEEALSYAARSIQDSSETLLEHLLSVLSGPTIAVPYHSPAERFSAIGEPSPAEFENRVLRAKEFIRLGDIFQVVISQRLHGVLSVDPFQVYRALRVLNPSPYLFFLDLSPTILIGSSPELLVKLEGRTATVRPIAGTRRRDEDPSKDREIERELLQDPKEAAEHVMLVDLGRNDLGRVCEFGSVTVTDYKTIERYSHVMHLVSYVRGTLREPFDRFDLLEATFPAGTVSGAPKVRAMEIIHELEDHRRGPYGGALGYFGPNGEMDLCITIRTVICHGDNAVLQAGAGIVADSDPASEHRECQTKMQALLSAIRMAEEGLK